MNVALSPAVKVYVEIPTVGHAGRDELCVMPIENTCVMFKQPVHKLLMINFASMPAGVLKLTVSRTRDRHAK